MTIEIIEANLLDSKEQYIAHQANCVTIKASHLAAELFSKFPYSDIYKERAKEDTPGKISIHGDGISNRFVINMLSQVYPGRPRYPESELDGYKARRTLFFMCLKQIANIKDLSSIAFPYGIGCGVAGGDWKLYYPILEKFEAHLAGRARVFLYKLPKKETKALI